MIEQGFNYIKKGKVSKIATFVKIEYSHSVAIVLLNSIGIRLRRDNKWD